MRFGDVAVLVVDAYPESESAADHEEMTPRTAADIDHPHPVRNDVLKQIELGAKEGLDLRRLRGRIQSPIQ
jgi:hypothetical protein